ncbi:DNA polymerase III subunit chi [Sphingomonas flavalba]|uniref:DNA polymerase III subunit chi n=1 Tax=Sphingomonas flavalba TaxID=2559804 RepID=UPI00109D87F1|nr:DNA polymerase III subunit chi [Sphingomonas flavalba]
MQVDFYHLTTSPVGAVLPRIAERVLGEGGRLLVVSADPAQRDALDRDLWAYRADAFLPHATAGDGGEPDQPVLIAEAPVPLNAARNIALVDGRWRDEATTFDRAFHFFDEDGIEAARAAWRALAEREGVERRYWKQDSAGRWAQVA